jgi:hypothetical protein
MQQVFRSLFSVAALVASLALISNEGRAATVTFSTAPSGLVVGDVFAIDLTGTDFTTVLDGGGVNISYNPLVLSLTSVVINEPQWDPDLSSPGTINNVTGLASNVLFSSFADRSGNLLFATLSFQAIGAGNSVLGLGESVLNPFAGGGELYPGISLLPGAVSVNAAVPAPAAGWLLLTALATLKRRRSASGR